MSINIDDNDFQMLYDRASMVGGHIMECWLYHKHKAMVILMGSDCFVYIPNGAGIIDATGDTSLANVLHTLADKCPDNLNITFYGGKSLVVLNNILINSVYGTVDFRHMQLDKLESIVSLADGCIIEQILFNGMKFTNHISIHNAITETLITDCVNLNDCRLPGGVDVSNTIKNKRSVIQNLCLNNLSCVNDTKIDLRTLPNINNIIKQGLTVSDIPVGDAIDKIYNNKLVDYSKYSLHLQEHTHKINGSDENGLLCRLIRESRNSIVRYFLYRSDNKVYISKLD